MNENLKFLIKLNAVVPMKMFVISIIALIYTSLINIIFSITMQKGIDYALKEDINVSLYKVSVIFFIITSMYGILLYVKLKKYEQIKQCIAKNLKIKLLAKLFKAKYQYTEKYEYGDILNRVNKDSDLCSEFLVGNIFPLLQRFITILVGLSYIFIKSVILGIVVTSILPLIFFISKIYSKNIELIHIKEMSEESTQKTFFVEIYNNINVFKIFNMTTKIINRNNQLFNNIYSKKLEKNRLINKMHIGANVAIYVAEIVILAIGIFIYNKNLITISEMLAVWNIAIGSVVWSMTIIPSLLEKLSVNYGAVLRINDIFKLDPDEQCLENNYLKNNSFQLICEKISYRYNLSSKYLFNNTTVFFKSNEIVFLTGKSGSGKSTLLKILAGLYDLEKGNIFLKCGTDKIHNLNNFVTYLSPEEHILNLSIIDNITLGKQYKFEDIKKIMINVNLHSYVMNLQNRYNTILNVEHKLSLGQEKRLSIARALFMQSKFILMDEPFSSIDRENIIMILKIVKKISEQCCFVIASHNKEFINFADKVINIEAIKNEKI